LLQLLQSRVPRGSQILRFVHMVLRMAYALL